MGQAVSGGPCSVPFRSCRQTGVQGQVVGRCSLTRRAERASRPGTLMSRARTVPVVARAWKAEARVPAARVRSKAIAAQTSQALLSPNLRRLLDGVTAARPQARAGHPGSSTQPHRVVVDTLRFRVWTSTAYESGEPKSAGSSNRTRVAPNPRPTGVMAGVRPENPSLALACTSSGSPRRRGVRGSPPRCA